jgi:regulator of replication initiation timing
MSQSGRELRAEVARLLNEREVLNLEVNRLRERMATLELNLRKLRESSKCHAAAPWVLPLDASNVVPFKREK